MAFASGTRIGPYELTGTLGAGGMGEVYRARDTRLKRDVALKVLPQGFLSDPERLARFQREAEILASLNHPNIAGIHGLEELDETCALVLELVDGPTLADRIAHGPIPLDEALPIARQLAEALEAAHEQGIVHRDLKPANIKVRPDGTVKVLDFGLAKAFESEPAAAGISIAPTITSPAATRIGTILGTAAYMSPEQARGKTVDKRSDIWAFGCVLYEMLTGKRAFGGDEVTEVLARVLERQPDFSALPTPTPPAIQQLLRRCLEKDPKRRLRDIGDTRLEMTDDVVELKSRIGTGARALGGRVALIAVVGILGVLVSVVFLRTTTRQLPSAEVPVTRMVINLPANQRLVAPRGVAESLGRYPSIAFSQDGTRVAYSASAGDSPPQLYVRDLGEFEGRVLSGTENAELPFFSPDGRWLGYLVDASVFRVSVEGGIPIRIGEVPGTARGAAWGPNDTVILGGPNTGLRRLDSAGGASAALEITRPNSARGEQYHAWPEILPDGEHVLFTAVTGESSDIGVLSLRTGEWRILPGTEGAAQPRYLNSGHLVFFRSGGLFATTFDLLRLESGRSALPVLTDVFKGWNAGLDIGYFAVSRSGTLVYVPGGIPWGNRVVLVDRTGREIPLLRERGRYGYRPAVSHDGTRLVTSNAVRPSSDLWVHEIERGTSVRLTSREANIHPVWSSDATRIIFARFRSGSPSFDLYSIAADGSSEVEPLLVRDYGQYPSSVSQDGRFLAFSETHPATGLDIHVLALDSRTAKPFAVTSADEAEASFSPDGRSLAYSSNESGRFEVYIRALAENAGKVTISVGGGRWPRWSPNGDELFYLSGATMMVVPVRREPIFRAGAPQPLFPGRYAEWYDVMPDGRFVMITNEQSELTALHLVLNWASELDRAVPMN